MKECESTELQSIPFWGALARFVYESACACHFKTLVQNAFSGARALSIFMCVHKCIFLARVCMLHHLDIVIL